MHDYATTINKETQLCIVARVQNSGRENLGKFIIQV